MRKSAAPNRYYQIEPRAPHLGGGWYVHCFESGVNVAQGMFPPDDDAESHQAAIDNAYSQAVAEAKAWLTGSPVIASSDATGIPVASNNSTFDPVPPSDARTWVGSGHA